MLPQVDFVTLFCIWLGILAIFVSPKPPLSTNLIEHVFVPTTKSGKQAA